MLMALDRHLEDPYKHIIEWPSWPKLLRCPMESIADHPWCNHIEDVPALPEELTKGSKEAIMERVDKGKGREETVSSDVVGPSSPVHGEEVRKSQCSRGRGRSRGHSQSRRPRKRVKSVATIDSDDDKPTEQCQPGSAKSYDIYNPPLDLEILPVD